MTTKPDHLALIERVQKILGVAAAPLDKLDEGKREVLRLIADGADELVEIASRRQIEMTAATPAGELDKRLDALDKREKEVARRVEIAKTVRAELENRIDAAREAERAAERQAAYDQALALHVAATRRIREFLDRIGPEGREVMQAYAASEAATTAVNRNLPAGVSSIGRSSTSVWANFHHRRLPCANIKYSFTARNRSPRSARLRRTRTGTESGPSTDPAAQSKVM
jgi:hypothetical protein